MADARQSHLSPHQTRLIAYLGARHPDDFFGGRAALAELVRRLRRAPRRTAQSILLAAPHGAGKSELLRQATLDWSEPGAELTPIYFDLAREIESGAAEAPRVWKELLRGALLQLLAAAGRIDAKAFASPPAARAAIEAACSGKPWKPLAEFAELADDEAGPAAFEALLQTAASLPIARPLILLDGAASLPEAVARPWLSALVPPVQRAGCALLIESPADPAAAGAWDLRDLEVFEMPPLSVEDALVMARVAAEARGAALDVPAALPVCERLGFWPGWIANWTRAIAFEPVGLNPRRIAEEAYVALLDASPWSRRLQARFEGAVSPALREKGLRLALKAASDPGTTSFQKLADRLGATPDEAERALRGMAALGLIEPAGMRWRGTQIAGLADWIALQTARADAEGEAGGGTARVALLAARLASPLAALQLDQAGGIPRPASQLVPDVLARFDGQALPEAFFKYYDYYEAAGRLDPQQRREAMLQSRQTIVVPETVGVAGSGGGILSAQHAEYQARAFRGGNYQRYAEELWIALDLSATRSLTTPEIQRAIEHAARERKRTGIENCRLWLIVGETVSADGMELLRREKVYCSNLEQLTLLRDLIAENAAQRRAETARASEAPPQPPAETGQARPRAVIDLEPGREPRAETTTLRLPAREESEYIAALMAEKVAIRADFGATEAGKIKTAVLEGTLNAIEHSPNPEKMIDIQFRLSPDAMEIVVENEGAHFDPGAIEAPDAKVKLAAGNKRGWGITLMKKFMDEVEYEPCNGGTRLRLIKRRTPAAPAAATGSGEDVKRKGRL